MGRLGASPVLEGCAFFIVTGAGADAAGGSSGGEANAALHELRLSALDVIRAVSAGQHSTAGHCCDCCQRPVRARHHASHPTEPRFARCHPVLRCVVCTGSKPAAWRGLVRGLQIALRKRGNESWADYAGLMDKAAEQLLGACSTLGLLVPHSQPLPPGRPAAAAADAMPCHAACWPFMALSRCAAAG